MPALNCRDTSGYVTDAAGQTYCLSTDIYPVTRGGFGPFGWDVSPTTSDRNNALDPRLAGIAYATPGSVKTLRIDNITPGTNRVRIALGDIQDQTYQYLQLKDGSTVLLTIDKPAGNSGDQWYDATGVLRTSPTDWVNNNAYVDVTMVGTSLSVILGDPADTGYSTLAHVSIASVGISRGVLAALIEQGDL